MVMVMVAVVEGVTANVVTLCNMRYEAADSHNCSFLQGETYIDIPV